MNSFFKNHILPVFIVFTVLLFLYQTKLIDGLIYSPAVSKSVSQKLINNYIYQFGGDSLLEDHFSASLKNNRVVVLGSSELTGKLATQPHYFLNNEVGLSCLSVGHAGNQTLSIATQLLANTQFLKKAKIVVLLSPGWFEAKPALGTSLESFLENNSERWLSKIWLDPSIPKAFKVKLANYIYSAFPNIINPSSVLKSFYYLSKRDNNIAAGMVTAPLFFFNASQIKYIKAEGWKKVAFSSITPNKVFLSQVKWSSLFSEAEKKHQKNTTNNSMGIDSAMYLKYYKGGKGHIWPVEKEVNQELSDLAFLCEVLTYFEAEPIFIMMPLNPYYYKELSKLTPTIDLALEELSKNKFRCLNLFTADTAKYNKALLKDVMHFDDYGWYKVNEFIVKNYLFDYE